MTVTDADGDTASDFTDVGGAITFYDDGPSVDVTGVASSVAVDETDSMADGFPVTDTSDAPIVSAMTSYGADGAGSTAYSLSIGGSDSGLTTAQGGFAITLVQVDADTIIGQYNDGVSDQTAFTVEIDGDGYLTVTQNVALEHADATDPNDTLSLTGLVSATVTVTDADGDTASDFTDVGGAITFYDDGPSVIDPQSAYLVNKADSSFTGFLDFDEQIENNAGADGLQTVRFAGTLDATDSGLTSGGAAIYYYISVDGQVLTAQTLEGDVVFTATLNPDGSGADTYTIDMFGSVDGGQTELVYNDDIYTFTGGNDAWAGFSTAADDASPDLLITPIEGGDSSGTINESANALGVSQGQSIGSGEAIRIDFVTDLSGDPPNGDYSTPANQNHMFDGHYTVNGTKATFTNTNGSNILIKAYDDPDGNNSVGDGTQDVIIAVAITYGDVTEMISLDDIGYTATDVTIGGELFTVQFLSADGSVTVDSVVTGTELAVYTEDGYNSIEYFHDGGNTFKIGDFASTTLEAGDPVDLTLPVEIVDGDGDVAGGSLDITLMPEATLDFSDNGAGVTEDASEGYPNIIGSEFSDTLNGDGQDNILVGMDGDDYISGGEGNDILVGGLGNDTLTGGDGADTFNIEEGHDTIVDYNKDAGDVVDISHIYDSGAGDQLGVRADGLNAELYVLDADGVEKGSVSFDTISFDDLTSGSELDSLLGQIDLDDGSSG
ncbi:MAG: DUF5801 repeats-in-toxin domain-containing protein [Desulfobacterales bacterium]